MALSTMLNHFTIILFSTAIIIGFESDALDVPVKYVPYQTEEEWDQLKRTSLCQNTRQSPEVQLLHQDIKISPGGCVQMSQKQILRKVNGRSFSCANVCKGRTYNIGGHLWESWSLSILMDVKCSSRNTFKLLNWQDLTVHIQCNQRGRAWVQLSTSEEQASYRLDTKFANLVIQKRSVTKNSGLPGRLAVYTNGSPIDPESETSSVNKSSNEPIRRATIKLGSDTGQNSNNKKSGGIILKAVDLFKRQLNDIEIKKESHFMYLKSINADYPECLCTEPPPYGTHSCPNGENRMKGEATNSPAFQHLAVLDGIIDPAMKQGLWPAKRKDTIFLRLQASTWLSGMEIYIFKQSITVFKEIGHKWHPLFCASDRGREYAEVHNICVERPETYSWEQIEGSPFQKLLWQAGQDINLVRSLKVEFEEGPYQDITKYDESFTNTNPVFEIKVFGSELGRAGCQDGIHCFPGNGNITEEHEGCGRCHCRDEKDSSSKNNCKPYISSILPEYGPVSGGTEITLFGGLLYPHIIRYQNTTIFIGDSALCSGIQRTDDNITCRTLPLGNTDLVNQQQPLKVNILIDGATYTIESQLGFTYKPDPIIERVTPYKSFLEGNHTITVKGKHLDSIFVKPEEHILKINIVGQSGYEAPCTVRSSETMACTMPRIQDDVVVKAHLGLALGDLPRYKNLSSALEMTEPMKIYPRPIFQKTGIVKLRRDSTILDIQGERVNIGCTTDEYKVTIGESECKVVMFNYNSLSCGLPKTGKMLSGQVVVKLYNYKYEIGHVRYENSDETFGYKNFVVIISIVVAVLLSIVIACGIFIFCRRRSLNLKKPILPDVSQGPPEKTINSDNMRPTSVCVTRPLVDDLSEILRGIEIDSRNLEIRDEIGRGHSGKVYAGLLTQGGYTIDVAVKTLKDHPDTDPVVLNQFLKEATMMKGFNHPNVLSLLGIAIEDGRAFVVLPYIEHGDLRGFAQNSRFGEVRFTKLIFDVAKGMSYLADRKFVHRDLAARNCMVDSSENVLVGDFGLARDIHENDYYRPKDRSQPLPYKWMAPESIEERNFSLKSDVWSYGVTAWEVFSHGAKPYRDIENFQLNSYLKRGLRLEQPPTCPSELYNLMSRCWEKHPWDRPTFTQIVAKLEQLLQGFTASAAAKDESKYIDMSSSTWDSGSETRVDETPDQQIKTDSILCLVRGSGPKQPPGKMETKENEDTDYLQPVCHKGVTACQHIQRGTN